MNRAYPGLIAAENLYRQALLADPNHVATLNNLGHLMHTHHNNLEEAESVYRFATPVSSLSKKEKQSSPDTEAVVQARPRR